MLYIKTKLKDGTTKKSEIAEDNTYAICSKCGKEIAVNLKELLSTTNPLSTDIVCPECTKKQYAKQNLTIEDIVLLTTALCRFGYRRQLVHLYEDLRINSIQQLRPEEYRDFAKALLCAVMEGGLA